MAKKYDSVTKTLVENAPRDWAKFVGLPADDEVVVIDAGLATVTSEADKVIKLGGPKPMLLHIEFQVALDIALILRLLRYNVLLMEKHGLPVLTVVILLRPGADFKDFSGHQQFHLPNGRCHLQFQYDAIRVWKLPVEEVLSGGLGTLPLAPVCDVQQSELPEIIRRMQARVDSEMAPAEQGEFWASTSILMGLKYEHEITAQLLKGVREMRESTTYQAILKEGEIRGVDLGLKKGLKKGRHEGRLEGRLEGAQRMLIRFGTLLFGPPDKAIITSLNKISDIDKLELLMEKSSGAENWEELIDVGRAENGKS